MALVFALRPLLSDSEPFDLRRTYPANLGKDLYLRAAAYSMFSPVERKGEGLIVLNLN